MLKILQARLQQYVNHELSDIQAGFRKGRGTRGQIANIHWIIKKARENQKVIYFCFMDYAKTFDYIHFSSVTQLCPTRWDPMNRSTTGLPVHHQLLESTKTHVHWVGDAIQPSHPLSSPSPPALNLSQHQGLFQWVSSLHQWPKYWSFSFNISPYNEYPGLISFRMDCLDLLAFQGTLKSLLQHHSSKASLLLCSAFFIVQHSHPYMTTGKTIALTRRTYVDKVMSLLFNGWVVFHGVHDQF